MRLHTARPRSKRLVLLIVVAAFAAVAATTITASSRAASPSLQVWLTTADGTSQLSSQPNVTLGAVSRGAINVSVDDSHSFQTISGFGAAFTDSSTYLMAQLKSFSLTNYNTLMNELFNTSTGLGLAFWRIPMTASDFNSTNTPWTSDDTPGPTSDPTQNFALSPQDTGHIIPVIKDALAINPSLQLFGSPWSPPAWMKSNGSMICNTGSGNATLLTQYYQAWADYFRKWISAYQANGIPIWGVTPQNEPLYCPGTYPGSSWDPASEASWVHNNLKPALATAGLNPVILGFDHNWDAIWYPQQLLSTSTAADYGAIASHCYGYGADPTMMASIHNVYSNIDQYETECSSDTYPTDIIALPTAAMALLSVQNWAKGVDLWNVALNSSNGPHLGGCTSCVPLVNIDTTTNGSGQVTSATVTLKNNYYQLGQLSKFVPVGSTHIASTVNAHGIVTAAFKKTNGQEVLVATNVNSGSTTFTVTWNGVGSFSYTLPTHSTVTFVGTVAAAPVHSSVPTAGHTYKIVSRRSGKPIGVYGASTADGGQVVQWTDDDDYDQQWTLVDAGGGYFNIVDRNSGKALDDTNGSTANGNQMQQWSLVNNTNQQWLIAPLGNGYYKLTNRTSGLVLDLTNGALGDGPAIQQWAWYSTEPNQQWQFIPVN